MPYKSVDERNRFQRRNYKRNKRGHKNSMLKYEYGITIEDYERMLTEQRGVCKICGNGPTTKALNVDHDHTTGRIRGLLCIKCNLMLGRVDRVGLDRVQSYLEGA